LTVNLSEKLKLPRKVPSKSIIVLKCYPDELEELGLTLTKFQLIKVTAHLDSREISTYCRTSE